MSQGLVCPQVCPRLAGDLGHPIDLVHGFLVYYRSLGAEFGVWICLGLSQHPGSFCLLRSELMTCTTPLALCPKDPGFLTDKGKPSLNGLRIREARVFSYKGSQGLPQMRCRTVQRGGGWAQSRSNSRAPIQTQAWLSLEAGPEQDQLSHLHLTFFLVE